jgi:Zn-dependent protease
MLISLFFQNPLLFAVLAVALLFSLCFHEFAHAYAADRLGDPTAKYLGRLTLDPRAHLDPLGVILLLTVGFGWGKPVPFNPLNLKNPRKDAAIISFAGPLSNIFLAVIGALLFRFVPHTSVIDTFLYAIVYYNLILAFFNLLPFHPLDGFKVVFGLLPINLAYQWQQMGSFGPMILLFLILTRSTGFIITPLVGFSLHLLGL